MSPHRSALVAAAALALVAGCADVTLPELDLPPDDYELPAPDESLDPADVVVGDLLATPCAAGAWGGGFGHLEGREEWATVDVFFGRETAAGPWDGPTLDDLRLVARHGGRVLHRLHVPGVRARMVLSRIPDLVTGGFWVEVREVPDDRRYDVPVSVGFDRPLTDADEALFEALGGVVEYRWDTIHALAGPLPDRSISELRTRADVLWVEHTGVACLQ